MTRYDGSTRVHVPVPAAAFAATAAWMTFIAFAAATSIGSATSPGDVVAQLLMAVGGAAVAVVAFVLAFRTRSQGPEAWLGIPVRPEPLPFNRRTEDKGRTEDRAA